MKNEVWAMPEERFKEMASEITVSNSFLNLVTFGPMDLSDKDKEELESMGQKYGVELKTNRELVQFNTALNERLFASH